MITLKNVNKKYGEKTVYENFNIEIEENKTLVVLGESGSGKTTLLNILSRLTEFNGETYNLPKEVSFVFQQDRLIPNMTVAQNLKFILSGQDVSKVLESAGLKDAESLFPKNLSAGMSRRVAFLRAFLYPSSLLLMDEPFINLDISTKYRLMEMLKKNLGETPRTCVIVTHDIKEAIELADRIVVISNGKLVLDVTEITDKTERELYEYMKNLKSFD